MPKETTQHDLSVPELGLGGQPIALSVWLVKAGAHVREGEPVVEILAGAATVDLPSPVDGVLCVKLAGEGDTIAVGQRLAEIDASF